MLDNCSSLLIFKNHALVPNMCEGVAKAVQGISSSSEAVYETVCDLQYFPGLERPGIFSTYARVNVQGWEVCRRAGLDPTQFKFENVLVIYVTDKTGFAFRPISRVYACLLSNHKFEATALPKRYWRTESPFIVAVQTVSENRVRFTKRKID